MIHQINQKVFEKFMVLETPNLILRELKLSDKERVLELHSSKAVNRFIYRQNVNSLEDASRYIEMLQNFYKKKWAIPWAATKKGTDELVGICSFNPIDIKNHRAEIDGELLPELWRTRLGVEGFLALLRFGFETMKLHSVSAKVYPENKSTVSLLEKFGFQREGHFKDRMFINGQYRDMYIYSLIKGNQTIDKLIEKYLTVYEEVS
ncbi:GNAT family protein [Bernardetia sp. ABR2-2B]|uniref:GNAT family N-acetyltransferase n=1 Tax=Bernardetia sp. ABR2-2B TaxID=3127472 RepID=UPI0030CD1C86